MFRKKYKYKSALKDLLAYEIDGDREVTLSIIDIDRNRIPCDLEKEDLARGRRPNTKGKNVILTPNNEGKNYMIMPNSNGRFPSQTFVCPETAKILDAQSGILKSGGSKGNRKGRGKIFKLRAMNTSDGIPSNEGGCSKILDVIDFGHLELDIFLYCAKASQSERNLGCQGLKKEIRQQDHGIERFKTNAQENHHPTVKPKALSIKIGQRHKLPIPQKVYIPFLGSGSEYMGLIEAGYTDIVATEINPEYIAIAQNRISYQKLITENTKTLWELL
jgi:site-specific DNA-methyltransferase (adenine-specific)